MESPSKVGRNTDRLTEEEAFSRTRREVERSAAKSKKIYIIYVHNTYNFFLEYPRNVK